MTDIRTFTLIGVARDAYFQKARVAAEAIAKNPKARVTIIEMVPADWEQYLPTLRKKFDRAANVVQSPIAYEDDNTYIGGIDDILAWARKYFDYNDVRPYPLYKALGKTQYKAYIEKTKRPHYFLEITRSELDRHAAAAATPAIPAASAAAPAMWKTKLVFELFNDICPKTCQNFMSLCLGDKGESTTTPGVRLHYVGSPLHRIVRGGWIQGGDICGGHGDSGESIYGPTFEDENYVVSHERAGMIGMCNRGRHTNGSQFYITLRALPSFDRKFVAFGRLVEGWSALKEIEAAETENQRPVVPYIITAAGEYVVE